jgi:hypothetical protein
MKDSHSSFEDRLPDDLRDVAVRLRSERAEATGLELDEMKTRAMATAAASRPKGLALKSRGIAVLLTLGLMAAGTGGVIAASSTGGSGGSSANTQYKPGCGPPPNGVNPSGTHTGPPGLNNDRANCPH